jgi:hypothetical protein
MTVGKATTVTPRNEIDRETENVLGIGMIAEEVVIETHVLVWKIRATKIDG